MNPLLDAFWRAAGYCLHPRIILLSLLPLLIVGGVAFGLGYFYWEPAVAAVRDFIVSWMPMAGLLHWFDSVGLAPVGSVLAPLVLVALAVPVIIVATLLLVSLLMTPAVVVLVAARRFPRLERRHGASFWQSLWSSTGCTLIALLALAISIPLWFVPPLILVLPPLIWGWLTYRVLSFDVLVAHASVAERRVILRQRRWPLFAMGVIAGYLGAAPSLLWAMSALTLFLAPLLIVVAVWLYTLVFAFSALWFAHYELAALRDLRGREPPGGAEPLAAGLRASPSLTRRAIP